MKKILLFVSILLLTSFSTFSQSAPYFTTEGFTPFLNNPAATGSWNKFSVNATYRNQWPAIPGFFKSFNFNVEANTQFGFRSSERKFNMPIGVNAVFEQFGFSRVQTINVPISIPIKLKNSTLAIGISAGIKHINFDWSDWNLYENIIFEPLIGGTVLDLNAGVFWYGSQYYFGASITNLTEPITGTVQVSRLYHLQTGYRFKVGQHYIFPMLNGVSDLIVSQLRVMTYFQFKEDIFSVGGGGNLRNGNFSLGGTVRIKKFKLAYVYDLQSNEYSEASGGSHEVRLSYAISK